LSDYEHDNLVNELEEMLDDTDIITPTLEALSNLKFQPKNTLQIVNKLFTKYSVINENDLPALVKFILKAANSLNSKEIFSSLCSKLNFEEITDETNRFQIFDILREYLYISSQLIEIFLSLVGSAASSRRVEEDNEDGESDRDEDDDENIKDDTVILRPFDFLIFSIIYSSSQNNKEIDKTFKLVIKEETWSNVQIAVESTLTIGKILRRKTENKTDLNYYLKGKTIMNELFDSLMLLAKSLISNANVQFYSVAQLIYKKAFEHLDTRHKHSLVQILIEHITCSSSATRDNSLDVLMEICSASNKNEQSNYNSLLSFSLELKSLLNFIEYFNLSQIRKVYFILCSIAYSGNSGTENNVPSLLDKIPSVSIISSQAGGSTQNSRQKLPANIQHQPNLNSNAIQDNLHILINKQLSSNVLKYKQIGK
jgi:hypothetical protein